MNNRGVLIGGLIVVVVVVIGLLLMANRAAAPAEVTTPATVQQEQDTTTQEYPAGDAVSPAVQGEVKEFTVTATEFKFSLNEMRVKQGDKVRVVLTNGGSMPHDWRVDEFDAATKTITNGQTDTVEFTADQKGAFEYYCSIGQHRENGMVGKLVVE